MSDHQLAGWRYAGSFCRKCEEEIAEGDLILVDADADYDGDGYWRDLTRVEHYPSCPPEEAA